MSTERPVAEQDYDVIDLSGFVRLFWRRRLLLLACAFVGAALAFALALVLHPLYESTVRLMPPTPHDSLQASLFASRNSGDVTLGLVSSRTVADDVIEHQHLAEYFHIARPSTLRSLLAGMAKISMDKDQFVSVAVRAKEPETAMRIANEFPAALYRLNRSMAETEAGHRRDYFEGPLEQEKNRLAEAEEKLKQAQQKTGVLAPQAQVQIGLTAMAGLRQQIVEREAQLAALETSSTGRNAQVVELKSQIASLRGQLEHQEQQQQGGGNANGGSAATMPERALEVERLAREVKYHETLFEIISKQYENARVDQSYSPAVSLVDRGDLPDAKVWPSRRLFSLIGFLLGGLLGMAWVAIQPIQPLRRFREFMNESGPPTADRSGV